MTASEFLKAWPVLKKQVEGLDVPYLDILASFDPSPFKILISCILSLRTQDKTTAEASKRLYRLADTPESMSGLSVSAIRKAIYPVGFYRVKAERIKKMSGEIAKKYNSRVPDTIEELLKLDGVGRKTANLVVTLGYNKDGICVDTHVHRITNRWGLVNTKDPTATEFALRKELPVRHWKKLNGVLVAFGQGICKPVSPICSACKISSFCDKRGVGPKR